MSRITFIQLEVNSYNGFIFSLLEVDAHKPNIDGRALFSVNASHRFLYVNLFFVSIKVFDKTE